MRSVIAAEIVNGTSIETLVPVTHRRAADALAETALLSYSSNLSLLTSDGNAKSGARANASHTDGVVKAGDAFTRGGNATDAYAAQVEAILQQEAAIKAKMHEINPDLRDQTANATATTANDIRMNEHAARVAALDQLGLAKHDFNSVAPTAELDLSTPASKYPYPGAASPLTRTLTGALGRDTPAVQVGAEAQELLGQAASLATQVGQAQDDTLAHTAWCLAGWAMMVEAMTLCDHTVTVVTGNRGLAAGMGDISAIPDVNAVWNSDSKKVAAQLAAYLYAALHEGYSSDAEELIGLAQRALQVIRAHTATAAAAAAADTESSATASADAGAAVASTGELVLTPQSDMEWIESALAELEDSSLSRDLGSLHLTKVVVSGSSSNVAANATDDDAGAADDVGTSHIGDESYLYKLVNTVWPNYDERVQFDCAPRALYRGLLTADNNSSSSSDNGAATQASTRTASTGTNNEDASTAIARYDSSANAGIVTSNQFYTALVLNTLAQIDGARVLSRITTTVKPQHAHTDSSNNNLTPLLTIAGLEVDTYTTIDDALPLTNGSSSAAAAGSNGGLTSEQKEVERQRQLNHMRSFMATADAAKEGRPPPPPVPAAFTNLASTTATPGLSSVGVGLRDAHGAKPPAAASDPVKFLPARVPTVTVTQLVAAVAEETAAAPSRLITVPAAAAAATTAVSSAEAADATADSAAASSLNALRCFAAVGARFRAESAATRFAESAVLCKSRALFDWFSWQHLEVANAIAAHSHNVNTDTSVGNVTSKCDFSRVRVSGQMRVFVSETVCTDLASVDSSGIPINPSFVDDNTPRDDAAAQGEDLSPSQDTASKGGFFSSLARAVSGFFSNKNSVSANEELIDDNDGESNNVGSDSDYADAEIANPEFVLPRGLASDRQVAFTNLGNWASLLSHITDARSRPFSQPSAVPFAAAATYDTATADQLAAAAAAGPRGALTSLPVLVTYITEQAPAADLPKDIETVRRAARVAAYDRNTAVCSRAELEQCFRHFHNVGLSASGADVSGGAERVSVYKDGVGLPQSVLDRELGIRTEAEKAVRVNNALWFSDGVIVVCDTAAEAVELARVIAMLSMVPQPPSASTDANAVSQLKDSQQRWQMTGALDIVAYVGDREQIDAYERLLQLPLTNSADGDVIVDNSVLDNWTGPWKQPRVVSQSQQ